MTQPLSFLGFAALSTSLRKTRHRWCRVRAEDRFPEYLAGNV